MTTVLGLALSDAGPVVAPAGADGTANTAKPATNASASNRASDRRWSAAAIVRSGAGVGRSPRGDRGVVMIRSLLGGWAGPLLATPVPTIDRWRAYAPQRRSVDGLARRRSVLIRAWRCSHRLPSRLSVDHRDVLKWRDSRMTDRAARR